MNIKANIDIRTEGGTLSYSALFTNVTQEFKDMMESDDAGYELEQFVQENVQFQVWMQRYGIEEYYDVVKVIFEGEPNFADFDDGDHLTIAL